MDLAPGRAYRGRTAALSETTNEEETTTRDKQLVKLNANQTVRPITNEIRVAGCGKTKAWIGSGQPTHQMCMR